VKSALLRFAPAYDSRIVTDPKFARTLMVQRGALEQINRDQPIPVLVDHDMSRQVGTVREIFVAPDITYGGVVQDWYFASVEIAEPPGWLKFNGGVSWSHVPLRTQDVNGSTRLLRGIISEVSVLSPSVKPAEGFACVAWVGEKERASSREQVIVHEPGVLVRRLNTGYVIGVR
jgi:hypothetical protein